jgi:hypothetical protein
MCDWDVLTIFICMIHGVKIWQIVALVGLSVILTIVF